MLTRNLPLKLAAIGLAVFLWFWVLLKEQNLIPQHTVRTAITEEGMGAGLALASPLPEAEVRVRGLKYGPRPTSISSAFVRPRSPSCSKR